MFIIWLFMTWPFSPLKVQDLVTGVIVSILVVLFIGKGQQESKKITEFKRYWWAIVYIPVLVYRMIVANLDVLYRVLHPDMPIRPGIVKIKTKLQSRLARALLCNSITLTPGTLSVDIVGDSIYVHWINVRDVSQAQATEMIAGGFERILKRIFE